MIASVLFIVLGNFTVTFFILGLIASAISLARARKPFTGLVVADKLLKYFVLFSIGISFLYNFVFHVFAGQFAAAIIGWADSPFQAEVGYASLGFGVAGLIAFRSRVDMRGLAIVGPALFLLGAAIGHIINILMTGNVAPGNAGAILYTDIALPIIGAAMWFAQRHLEARATTPERLDPATAPGERPTTATSA